LLDDSYESSKEIMMWLSPGIIFLSFSGIISHYYSAIGKLKTVSLYNSFGFIITIILAPILINKFGIGGAALTTNLAYFITFLASLIMFMKNTGLKLKDFFTVKEDIKALKEIFSGN
ncbi:MAG: polysaccharide biosynthesis C-terminal domain-containing protein, partial [Sphingobacteriaceae bacterium]